MNMQSVRYTSKGCRRSSYEWLEIRETKISVRSGSRYNFMNKMFVQIVLQRVSVIKEYRKLFDLSKHHIRYV
jgi:hypothetical protein